MSDSQFKLADPAIQRALRDIPTMQRWEILRRTQRPYSVAALAAEAGTSLNDAQRSLDLLVDARLVRRSTATSRRREVTYRAAMRRLFLAWDRRRPEDIAAKRAHSAYIRAYSRKVQDEAVCPTEDDVAAARNFGGWTSVMLLDEDARKVRDAFRAAYSVLAEADRRARAAGRDSQAHPFHVAFDMQCLKAPTLPMAEYFVFERGVVEEERGVLESTASTLLSPRERQIAQLLAKGRGRPEVAAELGLTPNTVASLSKLIYRKLGVKSRVELTERMRTV